MSKHVLGAATLLALVGVSGWVLAQQGQPAAAKATAAPGTYQIVASGQSAVLLEAATGRTWVLTQSLDGDVVWLPAQRLESDEQVRGWQKKERERAAHREQLQREMARKLEDLQRDTSRKLEDLQGEMARQLGDLRTEPRRKQPRPGDKE
jgi:hypothetical protein